MKNKGFSLIELLVVVAIIGILGAVGVVAYKGFIEESKDSAVIKQCSDFQDFMMSTLLQCALSPSSNVALLGIGGNTQTQDYSCDRSVNPTGTIINPIINHFNNIHKNVYGVVGGHVGPAMSGEGVCRGSGGNCNSFDLLEENNQRMMNLGRTYIQSQDDGHIAVTCFYDKGEFVAGGNGVVTEALQWTTPERFIDPRPQ